MKTNIVVSEDSEIWWLLRQATQMIAKSIDTELQKYGISMVQASVLFILKTTPQTVTSAMLSRLLFRTPQTVQVILDHMEKQDFVRRARDLPRRKSIRLVVTDKGEAIYQQASESKAFPNVISVLTYREREALRTKLKKLHDRALAELHLDGHRSVFDQDSEPQDSWGLWFLLNKTHNMLARLRDNELKRAGISMSQTSVLFVVKAAAGPVTPARISRWLLKEPHTVKVVLDGMEKKGLIKRTKDLPARNLIRVEVTDKGEHAFGRASEFEVIIKVMSSLSYAEREELREQLRIMRDRALSEIGTLQFSLKHAFL